MRACPSRIFSDEDILELDPDNVENSERMIRGFRAKNGKLRLLLIRFEEEQLLSLSKPLSMLCTKHRLKYFWYVSDSTVLTPLTAFVRLSAVCCELTDADFEALEGSMLKNLNDSTAIYLSY